MEGSSDGPIFFQFVCRFSRCLSQPALRKWPCKYIHGGSQDGAMCGPPLSSYAMLHHSKSTETSGSAETQHCLSGLLSLHGWRSYRSVLSKRYNRSALFINLLIICTHLNTLNLVVELTPFLDSSNSLNHKLTKRLLSVSHMK